MGIHTGEPLTPSRATSASTSIARRGSARPATGARSSSPRRRGRSWAPPACPASRSRTSASTGCGASSPRSASTSSSAPGCTRDFPPIRSLETLPNNLPRQLSSFVGRDHEILEGEERLREATTLTLTGPGGVGKTRLALEIGAHLVTDFEGGVWMVELASVDEGELVPDAVASALRASSNGPEPSSPRP